MGLMLGAELAEGYTAGEVAAKMRSEGTVGTDSEDKASFSAAAYHYV